MDLSGVGPQPSLPESGVMAFEESKQRVPTGKK
jgi:hypothetical protein